MTQEKGEGTAAAAGVDEEEDNLEGARRQEIRGYGMWVKVRQEERMAFILGRAYREWQQQVSQKVGGRPVSRWRRAGARAPQEYPRR